MTSPLAIERELPEISLGPARPTPTRPLPARRWSLLWPVVMVVAMGVLVTAVLTLVSARQYRSNEQRLLELRARDVGAVLTAALPSIQTPLASAAALADATDGNLAKFQRFISPYVGRAAGAPFDSVSLWRTSGPRRGPVAVVGEPPALSSERGRADAFLKRAAAASTLSVLGLLRGPAPRLGYAFTGTVTGPFAAYGESSLPAHRYSPAQRDSAFSDLDYALYLGNRTRPADLLLASVRRLPLRGRRSTVKVRFGDTFFTVAVVARGSLEGSLPERLAWGIAIVGFLLSAAAAALTARLVGRRRNAEWLAARLEQIAEENHRLYSEQRGIAQTLQHALLPERLPRVPGVHVGARYEAGARGMEVGGDWYDLIGLDDTRLLLVVGDVSGRGLRAAATMAMLRYAIHAYAAQGDTPETVLSKLSKLLSNNTDGQLATVLFALIDVGAHRVSVTSAGHLPPLMIIDGRGEFIESAVGLPVGVDRTASYASNTVTAPAGATLLAFTDGLVERRGESIETGLQRLRSHASSNHTTLEELLTRIVVDMRDERQAHDDTAIVGIQWID